MPVHHVGTSEENRVTPCKNRVVCKKRKALTESQTEILMETFQANTYPEGKELRQLAESFNVSKKKVQNWFSAKRRALVRIAVLPESE